MPERTALTHAEIHALAKVAAVVHDNGLFDPDHTADLVLDVCRKCSDAIARGEVLALVMPEMDLLTALANGRDNGRGSDDA